MFKEDLNAEENVVEPTEHSLLLNITHSNINNNNNYYSGCKCCIICYEYIEAILIQDVYKKFFYTILWWFIVGYITGLTNAIADNRALDSYSCNQHLRDLGFDFVSLFMNETYINPYSSDICLYISIISMLIYVFFTKKKKEIIVILTRYILMFDILFTLRSLNICLTVFPTPSKQKLSYSCWKWSNVAIAPFLIISGQRMSCFDFFFSGHTVNAVISGLIVTKYIKKDIQNQNINLLFYWIKILFVVYIWFTVFLVILFLLTLEDHYSIDISTAIMLTILFWYIAEYQIELNQGFFNWWHVRLSTKNLSDS